jgi:rare lipoprotein A (peptidoglycan hydrolase)
LRVWDSAVIKSAYFFIAFLTLMLAVGSFCVPAPDASAQGVVTTATYYHPSLHGNRMAHGGTYDRFDPTIAASNTYPAFTRLRVTRLATGRSIEVVMRDTGSPRLTLDLSEAGFQQLASLSEGRISVRVEVLE